MKTGACRLAGAIVFALLVIQSAAANDVSRGLAARAPRTADQLVTQYTCGDDGRLVAYVDPAGRKTAYEYRDGRLAKIAYADGSAVEYSYDDFGRRTAMKDWTQTTSYQYDDLNRLVRVEQPDGLWLQFEYDQSGRVSAVITPQDGAESSRGWRVEYAYDFLGRLACVRTPVGEFTWSYDLENARSIRTMPNGVTTTCAYDSQGRPASIRHCAGDGSLIVEFEYGYLPGGRLASETEVTLQGRRTTSYTYDLCARLTGVCLPDGGRVSYAYDDFDNRLSKTQTNPAGESVRTEYAYDSHDRIVRMGDAAFEHDRAGNICSKKGPGGSVTYGYDARNLLTEVNAAGARVSYQYDGAGRIVGRLTGAGGSRYLCMPFGPENLPLMEAPSEGSVKHYVRHRSMLCAVAGESVEFYLEDRLGSPRLVTGMDGKVSAVHDYQPFGSSTGSSGGQLFSVSYAQLVRDGAAGLLLSAARAYDPELGAFLQPDPLTDMCVARGKPIPKFAYCYNDPVNFTDANGAWPVWVWGPENFLWQVVADPLALFDAGAAKQWYADSADRALSSATLGNYWLSAGWASLVDVIGGYVPGDARTEGQAYASIMWSLVPGMRETGGVLKEALLGFGVGRTTASSVMNSARGRPFEASLDVLGLLGSWMSIDGIYDPSLDVTAAKWIKAGRIFKNAYDAALIPGQFPGPYHTEPRKASTGERQTARDKRRRLADDSWWDDQTKKFPPPPPPPPHFLLVPAVRVPFIPLAGLDDDSLPEDVFSDLPESPLSPVPVGGIYLGSTGKALADVGDICGVAADEATGRITLISRQPGNDVALPRIDLGDLAVIFRSVFLDGIAPYVSIEPDPANPEGPTQTPLYSPGTEGTRVGWIMFQADRLMKCYGVDKDNVTGQTIGSTIGGFQQMLIAPLQLPSFKPGSSWHRFWLEPLPVKATGWQDEVSFFDSPDIYVRIQRMERRGGKLVAAGWVDSDPTARPFKEWFTRNYDLIGREEYTQLPDPVNPGGTIAVFPELRRLAALVALAEQLKQKGVRPPQWLLRYPANRCPTPDTTPAIDVELSSGDRAQRIHGGVDLKPVFVKTAETPALAPVAETVRRSAANDTVPLSEPSIAEFASAGRDYRAVALPGGSAGAIGAFRQTVCDLEVPLDSQRSLRLSRSYCSFSDGPASLGRGWRFSLPRLDVNRVETRRTGDLIEYTAKSAVLMDALGSPLVEFAPTAQGEESGYTLLRSSGDNPLTLTYRKSLSRTSPVYHVEDRNGDYREFSGGGDLLTVVGGGVQTEYIYTDPASGPPRLARMVAMSPNGQVSVDVDWDAAGRAVRATSSSSKEVSFEYDGAGFLTAVKGPSGAVEYKYDQSGLLAGIVRNDVPAVSLEYNGRGQIARFTDATGRQSSLKIDQAGDGGTRAVWSDDAGSKELFYDGAMRVTGSRDNLGNAWQYSYGPDGSLRESSWKTPAGAEAVASVRGNSMSLSVDGKAVMEMAKDASAGSVRIRRGNENRELVYDPRGRLRSYAIRPADGAGKGVTISYNETGDVDSVRVGDAVVAVARLDASGLPEQVVTPRAVFDVNWSKPPAASPLPSRVASSDGRSWAFDYESSDPNMLRKAIAAQGSAKSTTWFENGLPVQVQDFDGGRSLFTYESRPAVADSPARPVLKSVVDPLGREFDFDVAPTGESGAVKVNGKRLIQWMYKGGTVSFTESSLPLERSQLEPRGAFVAAVAD